MKEYVLQLKQNDFPTVTEALILFERIGYKSEFDWNRHMLSGYFDCVVAHPSGLLVIHYHKGSNFGREQITIKQLRELANNATK